MSTEDTLNYGTINFPEDKIWIRIPAWEIAIKVTAFVPVIIFGLYGNFVILQLIVLNRALRTPTNMLVANMAIADILTLAICPIMFMIDDFYQNYQLGFVGCKTEGFLDVTLLVTAVLNLSAVSYDRLTAIVLPSETRLTMRGVKFVTGITWIGGCMFAVPLSWFRSYKVRQWKNFEETYCKENEVLHKYWYVLITVMVWLPLSIMVICYAAIFIKLGRHEKRVLNREHPLSVSYKKTVAKMVFVVLIAFIVLRLPFTILVLLRDNYTKNGNTGFAIFWYTAQFFMFLNAAVNPIIYGFNNDNFRRAYDQTPLCSCFRRERVRIMGKRATPSRCPICSNYSSIWSEIVCGCFCLRTTKRFSPAGEQNVQKIEVVRVATLTSADPQPTKETNFDDGQMKHEVCENERFHNIISDGFI